MSRGDFDLRSLGTFMLRIFHQRVTGLNESSWATAWWFPIQIKYRVSFMVRELKEIFCWSPNNDESALHTLETSHRSLDSRDNSKVMTLRIQRRGNTRAVFLPVLSLPGTVPRFCEAHD